MEGWVEETELGRFGRTENVKIGSKTAAVGAEAAQDLASF